MFNSTASNKKKTHRIIHGGSSKRKQWIMSNWDKHSINYQPLASGYTISKLLKWLGADPEVGPCFDLVYYKHMNKASKQVSMKWRPRSSQSIQWMERLFHKLFNHQQGAEEKPMALHYVVSGQRRQGLLGFMAIGRQHHGRPRCPVCKISNQPHWNTK